MYYIRSIIQTTTCSPVQWEGYTADNLPIYIRYRHGQLTTHINGTERTMGDCIYAYTFPLSSDQDYISLRDVLIHIQDVME